MASGARLMTGYSIIFDPGAEAVGEAGATAIGGQRLSSRPVRKGIYVRQGRKVVIR